MSQADDQREADRVADDAARWFVRLQADDAGQADWQAFEQWLCAADAHARAYEALEQVWVDLDEAPPAFRTSAPAPRRVRADRAPAHLSRRSWLVGAGALAASAAVAVVMVGQQPSAAFQTYSTAPGQTQVITLSDGTRIRLNVASTLRVAFDKHARRVEMADAEAVFDVAHDPARPFLISVGDRQVRVVGTEFNIRHRDETMVLTVRRGVVEVRPADAPQAAPARLTVRQQFRHRDGDPASTVLSAEPQTAFAWTEGQLIYRDAPMSQVAGDLTRQFGVPVRAADAAQLRFTGVLVTDSLPPVLRRLEAYAPVEAARGPDGVVLRRTDRP